MVLFESMVCEQEVNVESRAILISLPELEIRISSGVTLSVICPRVYKQEILMLIHETYGRSGVKVGLPQHAGHEQIKKMRQQEAERSVYNLRPTG